MDIISPVLLLSLFEKVLLGHRLVQVSARRRESLLWKSIACLRGGYFNLNVSPLLLFTFNISEFHGPYCPRSNSGALS